MHLGTNLDSIWDLAWESLKRDLLKEEHLDWWVKLLRNGWTVEEQDTSEGTLRRQVGGKELEKTPESGVKSMILKKQKKHHRNENVCIVQELCQRALMPNGNCANHVIPWPPGLDRNRHRNSSSGNRELHKIGRGNQLTTLLSAAGFQQVCTTTWKKCSQQISL